MANRVVITGMGAITPVGNDVETFWNSLKEKKTGFGEITYFDTADFKVKLAAQVVVVVLNYIISKLFVFKNQ